MVLPIFGIGTIKVHSEIVKYDHSCGDVQPGDYFTSDVAKVTCCVCKTICIAELQEELRFFRGAFPRAAENYKKVSSKKGR